MTTHQLVDQMWQPLKACFEFTVRNAQQAWTVQTHSREWDFGPYVQAQYLDGEIIAEITSNSFLQPGLPIHAEQRLRFLGWIKPFGNHYPNWYKVVPHTVEGHEAIATLWVNTLIQVYGMDEQWQFTVAPLSIDFIRAWRNEMVPSRAISTYKLADTNGQTQGQKLLTQQISSQQQVLDGKLSFDVGALLRRAKKLGLAGTDLIRLAQCEASVDVVTAVTALVYAEQSVAGIRVAKEDVDELELYREIEFDEFAGIEFFETNAIFDHNYNHAVELGSAERRPRSVS